MCQNKKLPSFWNLKLNYRQYICKSYLTCYKSTSQQQGDAATTKRYQQPTNEVGYARNQVQHLSSDDFHEPAA